MRSPFPGMDPYLEDPGGWPNIHHRLISSISDQLMPKIAPRYSVSIEERVYMVDQDDLDHRISPDLAVRTRRLAEPAAPYDTITRPVILAPAPSFRLADRYIDVVDRKTRTVVTTIEVLSPINKRRGSEGFRAFTEKRQQVMDSETHWVEIDLLRAGERPARVMAMGDYYGLLHRGDGDGSLEVWPIQLRERLPTIAIPLRAPDSDVALDLQRVCADVYARGMLAYDLDYREPPPAPGLSAADAAWSEQQIAAWRAAEASIA